MISNLYVRQHRRIHGVMYSIARSVSYLFLICSDWKLFLSQLQKASNSATFFSGVSANPKSAPVGVNPTCGILRVGSDGSLGNIANIIACALSMIFVAGLIVFASRRKAAVGECSRLPDRSGEVHTMEPWEGTELNGSQFLFQLKYVREAGRLLSSVS